MPLKKNNPGCKCCNVPCMDWTGDPPEQIQLTLPAGCERAGTHVLDYILQSYTLDCPSSTLTGVTTLCAGYLLELGTGDARDAIYVNVWRRAGPGDNVIIAGVCNETGSASSTDAGTMYGMITGITDWNDLDGLSLPFTNRVTDTEGMADCSTDDPATLSFVP